MISSLTIAETAISKGELILLVVGGVFTVAMTVLFFAILRMAKKEDSK